MRELHNFLITKGVFRKKIFLAATVILTLALTMCAWFLYKGGTSRLVGTWLQESDPATSYSHYNYDVLELFKDGIGVRGHSRGLGPVRHFRWKAENGNLYMFFENVINPNTSSSGVSGGASGGLSFFGINLGANLGVNSSFTTASAADADSTPYKLSWSALTLNDKYTFKKVKDVKAELEARERELSARQPRELTIADLKGGTGYYILTQNGSLTEETWKNRPGGAVWKDGKTYQIIPKPGKNLNVSSLFVSGGNVYIAGNDSYDNASYLLATLWTNGTPQTLDNVSSVARVVYVQNNTVYVAGERGLDETSRPVLWKNGNMRTLDPSGVWYPTHISGSSDNVYVVGQSSDGKKIILWKNEEEGKTLTYEDYPYSYSRRREIRYAVGAFKLDNIFTLDNDVYITAQADRDHEINDSWAKKLLFYKNGKIQKEITFPFAPYVLFAHLFGQNRPFTKSIYTSDENIYILIGNRLWKWKLDEKQVEEQMLEDIENPETLQKIEKETYRVFVSGGNVYVLGARNAYKAGGTEHPKANVLWKNGKVAEIFTTDFRPEQSIRSFLVVE